MEVFKEILKRNPIKVLFFLGFFLVASYFVYERYWVRECTQKIIKIEGGAEEYSTLFKVCMGLRGLKP